jgi:uncharacterized repeat protein (TIGR03803 family)
MRTTKISIGSLVVSAALTMISLMAGTHAVAQTETVLFSFSEADGSIPLAGLIFDAAGNLYGTTSAGGSYGGGTVFELSPAAGGGWTEMVLHSFDNNGTDGFEPSASLVLDAEGNLYGTTVEGGGGLCMKSSNGPVVGCGTVFELTAGVGGVWTEKILYVFGIRALDGIWPYSNLVFDSTGNLYGTTSLGGSHALCYMYGKTLTGCGTVFELKPNRNGVWTEKILHNFGAGTDGEIPSAGVVFDAAGNLYGTTTSGGPPLCGENGKFRVCGIVFELIPEGTKGWNEKQVTIGDTGFPTNLAIDPDGNLYVAADSGGSCGNDYNVGCGIVFELASTGGYVGTIGNFGSGSDPSALILDAQGNVYGTTENILNQDIHESTVYEASQSASGSWEYTVLYQFNSNGSGGSFPSGGLVRDTAGNLYGTTQEGGKNSKGVAFEITP